MTGTVSTLGDGTPIVYVTTVGPHFLSSGRSVVVTGLNVSVLGLANGTWVVTVTGPTTFTYTVPALNGNQAAVIQSGVTITVVPNTDPQSLLSASACYSCYSAQWALLELSLLSQIVTNIAGCRDGGVSAAWAQRVVTNGGAAVSAATQAAVCAFVAGAIADGFWNDLLIVNIFAPDNLIACKTPLVVAPTGPDPWTDAGIGTFAAGDLSVNGLKGGINQTGGNIKSLKASQTVDSGVFTAVTNCGMTIYESVQAGTNSFLGGCLSADQTSGLLFDNYVPNAAAVYAATLTWNNPGAGYYSVNRTSNAASAVYFANSTNAHSAIVSSGGATTHAFTGYSLAVFDVFFGGATLLQNTSDTLSYASFHNGLSSAKSANQFARVQALRTALGGGFI